MKTALLTPTPSATVRTANAVKAGLRRRLRRAYPKPNGIFEFSWNLDSVVKDLDRHTGIFVCAKNPTISAMASRLTEQYYDRLQWLIILVHGQTDHLVQGTLDLLILKTISLEPKHGSQLIAGERAAIFALPPTTDERHIYRRAQLSM